MPQESTPFFVAAAVCWLLALLAWLGCRRACRRYNAIFEVPTIAARDIPGLGAASVEVSGIAEADEPLLSDLARVPCVAFACAVTEHWTTTRVVRDSKGKSRTVTQHHSETRYSNSAEIPFRVRDESGAVVVQPAGACIEMLNTLVDVREPQFGSPAYGISPRRFGGRLSFSETALPTECKVYVLGQVGEDHAIRRPEYSDRPFIISHRTEAQLLNSARWGRRIWGAVAAMLFIGGFVVVGLVLEQRSSRSRWAAPEYRRPVPASPAPPLPHQAERETWE